MHDRDTWFNVDALRMVLRMAMTMLRPAHGDDRWEVIHPSRRRFRGWM